MYTLAFLQNCLDKKKGKRKEEKREGEVFTVVGIGYIVNVQAEGLICWRRLSALMSYTLALSSLYDDPPPLLPCEWEGERGTGGGKEGIWDEGRQGRGRSWLSVPP